MKKIVRNLIGSMGALNDATNNQKISSDIVNAGTHQTMNQNSLYSALLRGEKTEEVQNFVAWMNLVTETVENSKVVKDGNNLKVTDRDVSIGNLKSFFGDPSKLIYRIRNTRHKTTKEEDRDLLDGKLRFSVSSSEKNSKLLTDQVDYCNVKEHNGNKLIDLVFEHNGFTNFKFRHYDFNDINRIAFVSDRYDLGCYALREFEYGDLSFVTLFNVDKNTTIVTLLSESFSENESISEKTMTETVRSKYTNNLPKTDGTFRI